MSDNPGSAALSFFPKVRKTTRAFFVSPYRVDHFFSPFLHVSAKVLNNDYYFRLCVCVSLSSSNFLFFPVLLRFNPSSLVWKGPSK